MGQWLRDHGPEWWPWHGVDLRLQPVWSRWLWVVAGVEVAVKLGVLNG